MFNTEKTTRYRRSFVALLAACAVTVGSLSTAQARGPKGGGPGGVIYFGYYGQFIQMNGDGSGKTVLPLSTYGGDASHATHGGGRWFLLDQDPGVLGAIKDDGTIVPLILPGDDGDWEVVVGIQWMFDVEAARAGFDGTDGLISWAAERFDENGQRTIAVSFAPVAFNPDTGDVAGLDLTAVQRIPDVVAADWSPDGTQLLFFNGGRLWFLDVYSGAEMPFPVETATLASWSPDGSRIAFLEYTDLVDYVKVIDLEDLSETTVGSARRRTPGFGDRISWQPPQWAPSSTHLLFVKRDVNKRGWISEENIIQVRADGAQSTNLTSDLNTEDHGIWLNGWR